MYDLRCPSKLHGRLDLEDSVIEIKCNSRFCGSASGVVVLHLYDAKSGALLKTSIFKDPERRGQEL